MTALGEALERHTRAALNLASAVNVYQSAGQMPDLPPAVMEALREYWEATEAVMEANH